MSDNQTKSPVNAASSINKNELAIISAKYDRKVIMEALKNGTLSCLPDPKTNVADTKPAVNITNGTAYHGVSLLLLKDFQTKNKFPTAEYLTFDAIEAANKKLNLAFEDKVHLIKGSKGISISYRDGEETKSIRLFNIAQVINQDKIRDYATIRKFEQRETLKNYFTEKGQTYYPPKENSLDHQSEKKTVLSKTDKAKKMICSSCEPVEYLTQYLAAVSLRKEFIVPPEIASSFVHNTEKTIFEKNEAGHINPFNLYRLGAKASQQCKEYIKTIAISNQKVSQEVPQKEKAKKQSIDYGISR